MKTILAWYLILSVSGYGTTQQVTQLGPYATEDACFKVRESSIIRKSRGRTQCIQVEIPK